MGNVRSLEPRVANGFGGATKAETVAKGIDLSGKTILVTGGNTGLGFETSRVLALHGAQVVITSRDQTKATTAVEELKRLTGSEKVEFIPIDLADLASVRECATEFKRRYSKLDVLICNAGIMNLPQYQTSTQGIELQFATNHLGHFLLANLLLAELKASPSGGRLVVSSAAHKLCFGMDLNDINYQKKAYGGWNAYYRAKACNVLFAKEWDHRFAPDGVHANSLHPGIIMTQLFATTSTFVFKTIMRPLLNTIQQGAATSVYVAIHPGAANAGGVYFENCNVGSNTALTSNMKLAKELWDKSEELCGDFLNEGRDIRQPLFRLNPLLSKEPTK